jgi:hypothetical protein
MDTNTFQLSLEQQFELQCIQHESQNWEQEQIINYLLESMQQLMVKDNLIRDLMKKARI